MLFYLVTDKLYKRCSAYTSTMTATCKLLMPRLVFCCPALPVVLSVGRISNTLGIPYAFCDETGERSIHFS